MKVEIRGGSRRALFMLAAALTIYALANWVVLPAYDHLSDSQEQAAEKETQLRRYRRAELRKGQYTDLLKLAADRLTKSESIVIPASNVSLASAELQAIVEATTSKVGVALGQRMIGVPRRLNNFYAEIPMTLSFESTPAQMVSFLNELRAQPRFLSVRALQVFPVSPVFEAPKGVDLAKNIRVSMTVSGLCSADLLKPAQVAR
jgi:Tfp pilus assembly protein PilO